MSVTGQAMVGRAPRWRSGVGHWVAIAIAAAAVVVAFWSPLRFTVATWGAVEEYSYGYLIPFISAFLIWQRSDRLRRMELSGSWGGIGLLTLAIALLVVGELSALRTFGQYGFVVAVVGLSACAIGWRGTRAIAMPLAFLLFMIPLPQFALREISEQLQLVSSQLGVAMIRMAGISVFLDGNVIDLGAEKLQVAEACSGLRYLFPLMVLGGLAAYFFQGRLWQRVLIVVSTLPLTIVINSLRIGLIGISVELWGQGMAEGVLHDLEGWFMFLVCLAALVGEMALLARLGDRHRPLSAVLGLELPAPLDRSLPLGVRRPAPPLVGATLLVAVAAAAMAQAPERGMSTPARTAFTQFPLELPGGWRGQPDTIDPNVLSWLAVDDYFIANYRRGDGPFVNFYAAYYASQSSGQSSHSPRTCMPGGGWHIDDLREVTVAVPRLQAGGLGATRALAVNRAVITKGDDRQLVYYWFRQRGRDVTDEFQVKWLILRDAIVRDRSDGALLRLVTPIAPGEDAARADARLTAFLSQVDHDLPAFVPN